MMERKKITLEHNGVKVLFEQCSHDEFFKTVDSIVFYKRKKVVGYFRKVEEAQEQSLPT